GFNEGELKVDKGTLIFEWAPDERHPLSVVAREDCNCCCCCCWWWWWCCCFCADRVALAAAIN
ncbi:unnamed protein product, partial [Rotaria magnacalcarata]